MRACAICLYCDDKLVFALGNILIQLKKFRFFEKILVHLQTSNQLITEVIKNIDDRIEVFAIDEQKITQTIQLSVKLTNFIEKYGVMPLLRYESINYLRNFENIIICDVDLLILRDFSAALSKSPLAWRETGDISRYCDQKGSYPNGGFIVLNKSLLDYIDSPDVFYNTLEKLADLSHPDELVWGYVATMKNIPVRILPREFNAFPADKNSRDSIIVHGVGKYKFWTNPISDILFYEWREINNEWNHLCEKHNCLSYMFKQPEDRVWTTQRLFLMDINCKIYRQLCYCHEDLVPIFNIAWDFVQIHICSMPTDLHFEIKSVANLYEIHLHDEAPDRVKSVFLQNQFVYFCKSKANMNVSISKSRLDAYCTCSYENIKKELLALYSKLNHYLRSYINSFKYISFYKDFDGYLLNNADRYGIFLFDETKSSFNKIQNYPGLTIKHQQQTKCSIFIQKGTIFHNASLHCSDGDLVVINQTNSRGLRNLIIDMGGRGKCHLLIIGRDSSCESMRIAAANESCTICKIGNDNLISSNVVIRLTDGHKIKNENNEIINRSQPICLGNRVWIGSGATILKGSHIGDESIVGTQSVVTGRFLDDKLVIAGNPAKIVKKNIAWEREYLE